MTNVYTYNILTGVENVMFSLSFVCFHCSKSVFRKQSDIDQYKYQNLRSVVE